MSQQNRSNSQGHEGESTNVDELEAQHFRSIVEVFQQYESYSLSANNRRRKDFYKLPLAHQRLLEELGWRKRLEEVDKRIAVNAAFLRDVVDNPDIFAVYEQHLPEENETSSPVTEGIHRLPPSRGERQSRFHDAPPSAQSYLQRDATVPSTIPRGPKTDLPAEAPTTEAESSLDPSGRQAIAPEDPAAQSSTVIETAHVKVPGDQDKNGLPSPASEIDENDDHPYARLRRLHEQHQHEHPHPHDHSSGLGHSHSHSHGAAPVRNRGKKVADFDMDKLRSTLKQFSRDWSEEGKAERESCYKPMLDALLDHFSDVQPELRKNLRVLVPGVGLGRLAWDIATLGFTCQGNEFSHFMLLSSYFILNRTERIDQHIIYPYIHSFSNVTSSESMLRAITIPDVLPSDLPEDSDFSLVAGDFEEIYGISDEDAMKENSGKEPQEARWHAVVTCFFIDTAKDIVNYLKIIHRILAPGGIWINLGPLLWHFENNSTGDPSIELNLEEVKELSRMIGFEITNERTIPTTYTGNVGSMLRHEYQAAFWVGKKN